MNKEIVKQFFPKMVDNFEKGLCSFCGEKIQENEFKDDLSKKEYEISGLCVICQNKVFEK